MVAAHVVPSGGLIAGRGIHDCRPLHLDRWLAPKHRYFKLRSDDYSIFIMRQDTASGCWDMTEFDSGSPKDRINEHDDQKNHLSC